jgi:hypothetical protein
MLIHQVPNSPAYLRVKTWRRLQKIGAVAVKNAVYVLPRSDQSTEDFHWIAREIIESGGDASVCEATFIEGLTTKELIALFQEARNVDYAELKKELRGIAGEQRAAENTGDTWASGFATRVSRLRQWFTEVQAIDFFPSSSGKEIHAAISELEGRIRQAPLRKGQQQTGSYSGRVWVTRTGVHIDRISSAWLIRRFIDSQARFKFVAAKGYRPEAGELRFDMFDAEFTHEGALCTFEVLMERFSIADRSLRRLGEIVHDIDLNESTFGHPETAGVALIVNAICSKHKEDSTRIERATILLDDLYEYLKKR